MASSLNEYREASLVDASIDLRGKMMRSDDLDPQKEYEAAQKRWSDHLAALKAAGKSSDTAALEAKLHEMQSAPSLSQQLDAAMQAGRKADEARHWDEAVTHYKQAVELAEKVQPRDQRLLAALNALGNNLLGQDKAAAQAVFEREFQAASELAGPQSLAAAAALQSLAQAAVLQNDYAKGEKLLFQAVDINQKVFGEDSDRAADALRVAADLFVYEKKFSNAEPYLLRVVHIYEGVYGSDGIAMTVPLSSLCNLYDKWDKAKESDACYEHLLTVLEKQYGHDNPVIVSVLLSDAKALRAMGRTADAEKVDQRAALIRAATMKP